MTPLVPANWLIGPLQQSSLDYGLQQEWPEAVFFDYFNAEQRLQSVSEIQGLLILEPLWRACPPAIWQLQVPRIAICSAHPQLPFDSAQAVLSAFDGLIAFEDMTLPERYPDLPFAAEALWDLQQSHLSQGPETHLMDILYIIEASWSLELADYAAQDLPLDYFIHVHPARAQFYLSRSDAILLDSPRLSSLHFQALASGRPLIVSQAQAGLSQYFTPGQDYGCYTASELATAWQHHRDRIQGLKADRAKLAALCLRPTLLRVLAAFGQQTSQPLPPAFALQQLAFSSGFEAFATRKALLDQQTEAVHLLACWFYLHTVDSPHLLSDSQTIWQAFELRWAALPPGPEKSWLALRAALQRKQYRSALNLLQQDPWLQLDQLCLPQAPGFWPADPVLEDFIELWNLPLALRLWLDYVRALCLAHLQAESEAVAVLESCLQQHYTSGAMLLWLQLIENRPALRKLDFMAQMLAQHPLYLSLAELYVRDLAQQDLPAALAQSESYLMRCTHLYNQLLYLERWLALRAHLRTLALDDAEADTRLRVFWEGAAASYSSLAAINRRWMLALADDAEIQVSWLPFDPPEQPPERALQALQHYPLQAPDIFVAHRWPPRRQAPAAGRWVNIFPWEFGVIPESWVQQMNHALDQIWVPSRFVAHSFEISGVLPTQMTVIPNGVDTQILRPEGPRYPLASRKGSHALRLLFVGGLVFRKGVDILLKAYRQAFTAADDVLLVIKSFGNNSHYAFQGLQMQLQHLQADPDAPEILVIEDDLSAEDLAALYRACDVYVHPYRGEGFGMPILEAMACGLPVVIPNAGPAPEFCPPEASWQVYTRLRFEATRDVQGQGLARLNPYFSEVDVSALAATLQTVFSDFELRQRKGQAAAAAAKAYDWRALYPQLKAALQAVVRQTPIPQGQFQALQTPLRQRLYLQDAPLPLRPQTTEHCVWLYSDSQPDLCLSRELGADICYLSDSHLPAHLPEQPQVIWCSAPEQWTVLQTEWQARHWPIEALHLQPLAVDFSHFSPQATPLRLEDSQERFAFLSLFDWQRDGAWQDLLRAYLSTFHASEPVNLVLKPYGAPSEQMLTELLDWLAAEGHDPEAIPGLSFLDEALDYARLPGLFRGCDAFVTAHASGGGIWHLAAQASGLPVLACGHYPFLQRPFAEVFAPGDTAHLSWLLRQLYTSQQPEAALIVRKALQSDYDMPVWQLRAERAAAVAATIVNAGNGRSQRRGGSAY